MDLAMLAQQSVALLAPCLPYLLLAGQKVGEGVAKEIGADAWKQAKSLWSRLGPKVQQEKAAAEATRDLSEAPDNPDFQTVLKVQIEKLLKRDTHLAREVDQFFKEAGASGLTIQAIGKRSVAAHTISGSKVVTGDQTVPPKGSRNRKKRT